MKSSQQMQLRRACSMGGALWAQAWPAPWRGQASLSQHRSICTGSICQLLSLHAAQAGARACSTGSGAALW